jgi:hypothetical protein
MSVQEEGVSKGKGMVKEKKLRAMGADIGQV